MRRHLPIVIIAAASLIAHFLFFGQPQETVFDEVHFGKFMSGYLTHEYFFDIHPPLGKLLISGAGYIAGFQPGFSFAEIGQQFPDNNYQWLRLLPTLAGTLLPVVIFLLILQLGMSRLAAFAGSMLIVFENALLVQSRFILLDSFLLLFGFLSLLFYFKFKNSHYNQKPTTHNLFFAGLFSALAISVKWTGVSFLAIILILELQRCHFYRRSLLKMTTLKTGLALIILPLAVYFSLFTFHFLLLSKSGPGDAFMTPGFRKTLAGSEDSQNPNIQPLNIFGKFAELNLQMYSSNANLTATHPYSSQWYTWPFMIRPIYYWIGSPEITNPEPQTTNSRIYLLGNPAIWWASTVAIIYLFLNIAGKLIRRRKPEFTSVLLVGAYLFNLLPFVGIKRALFLYHYLIALVFAIMVLVYLIDQASHKKKKRIFAILLVASLAIFIFFAPLSYGLPLTERAYNLRVWFQGWL